MPQVAGRATVHHSQQGRGPTARQEPLGDARAAAFLGAQSAEPRWQPFSIARCTTQWDSAWVPCPPQYPANALAHRGELLAYVTSDRIRSNAQLDGALEYLGKASRAGARPQPPLAS